MTTLYVTGGPDIPPVETRAVMRTAKAYIQLLCMQDWVVDIQLVPAQDMPSNTSCFGVVAGSQPRVNLVLPSTPIGGTDWTRDVELPLARELIRAALDLAPGRGVVALAEITVRYVAQRDERIGGMR